MERFKHTDMSMIVGKKPFNEWSEFDRMKLSENSSIWGYDYRRALFRAACKYLGMDEHKVDNLLEIGVHSLLHSSTIQLDGNILEKVKGDPTIVAKQNEIIQTIKQNPKYLNFILKGEPKTFSVQLGGNRARAAMWEQALEFWKWHTEYSATWEMAFNELTWAVRSTRVTYSYTATTEGEITIRYAFSDILDLRPDWTNRTWEYNAICTVLGFLYHDVLGGNDELKITANWSYITR